MKFVYPLIAVSLMACAETSSQPDAGGSGGDAGAGIDAFRADAGPLPDYTAVYAHSATELYRVAPDTLNAQLVGTFSFAGNSENITDIAIDKNGVMTAVSLNSVYSIDPDTAVATLLTEFPPNEGELTSLSYVPVDLGNPNSAERLVGADFDGVVWEINPQTGQSTMLGNYNAVGSDIGSSGDIVAISGFGILATVNVNGEANDYLAQIDPATWQATLLGNTGYDRIFGIGFWRGEVYGFTDNSEFLTLSPNTGATLSVQTSNVQWWGAGVTTLAPIVE